MMEHRIRLAFRQEIPELTGLATGHRHRVVLIRQRPSPAHLVHGFASGCSFPGLFLLPSAKALQEFLDEAATNKSLVLGHTDASGSAQDNKLLSERRARAAKALLTSDADELWSIAQEEKWSVWVFQAMLRALGFICGPIDDEVGPMTRDGLRAFADVCQRGLIPGAALTTAEAAQGLTDKARKEILRAYVVEYGLEIAKDCFLGPQAVGCFSLNLSDAKPDQQRAVSLVRFSDVEHTPTPAEFPCIAGSKAACDAVIEHDEPAQCAFYRTFVADVPDGGPPAFFDFRWHRKPNGHIFLSALTTATDRKNVPVSILLADFSTCDVWPTSESPKQPQHMQTLGETKGVIRGGVFTASWDAKKFDPFDFSQWNASWFAPLGVSLLTRESDGAFRVPTFRISVDGYFAYSPPPGHHYEQLHFAAAPQDGRRAIAVILATGALASLELSEVSSMSRVTDMSQEVADFIVAVLGSDAWNAGWDEASHVGEAK